MTIILTILIGVFVTFCVGAVWFSEHKSSKSDKVITDAFGDARALEKNDLMKEIKHNAKDAFDLTSPHDEHEKGGFVVNTDKKDIIYDSEQIHELIVAGTGAGKTTTKIIPTIMAIAEANNKESMILSDVKGELYGRMNVYLQDLGYQTVLLNFSQPKFGEQLNQLEACNKYMRTALKSYYKFKAIEYLLDEVEKDSFRNNKDLKLEQLLSRYKKIYLKVSKELKQFQKNKSRNRGKNSNDGVLIYKQERTSNSIIHYLIQIKDIESVDKIEQFLEKEYYVQKDNYKNNEEDAQKQALSISNMIMGANKKGEIGHGDAIWDNSAEMLITSLIMLISREGIDEHQKHLGSVYRFLMEYNKNRPEKELKDKTYLDTLISEYGKLDCIASTYNLINSATANTKTSMMVSGIAPMRIFGYDSVISQACSTSFDLDDLIKKPLAVFLYTPGKDTIDSKAYTMLASLAVEQIYSYLKSVAEKLPEKTLPKRVNFLLDEFANMPRLSEIGAKVSLARSYNIRFMLVVQEIAQLEQLYGKEETKNIITNCNLAYMKTQSTETAERISKMCGKETVKYQNLSNSSSKNGESNSESTATTGKDLFSVDRLLHFKFGESLLLQSGRSPIHASMIGWWDFPVWGDKVNKNELSSLQSNERSLLNNDYFLPEYDELQDAIVRMRDNTLFEGINLLDTAESLDITKAPLNEPKPESEPLPDEKKDDDAKELIPVQAEQQEVLDDAPIELIPEEGTRIKTTTKKQQKMAVDKVKKAFKYEVKKNINIQDMNESEKEEMISMLSN